MKSLAKIKIVLKVARVVSLIAFICAIIGEAALIIAISVFHMTLGIEVDGKTIADLLKELNLSVPGVYMAMAFSIASCAVLIYLTKHLEHTFKELLKFDSPMNRQGVKMVRRTALIHAIIGGSLFIICAIVNAIVTNVMGIESVSIPGFNDVIIALGLYIISLFMEYPVELDEMRVENEKKNQIDPEDYQE